MSKSALMILSAQDIAPLSLQFGQQVASILKSEGVSQLDLAQDPYTQRLINEENTGNPVSGTLLGFSGSGRHAYPVPDFDRVARNLSETLFRPVIGQSDMYDLRHLQLSGSSALSDMEKSGQSFFQASGQHRKYVNAGKRLGLILYAAIINKTRHGNTYDTLIYPSASGLSLVALRLVHPHLTRSIIPALDSAGFKTIDLVNIRRAYALTQN